MGELRIEYKMAVETLTTLFAKYGASEENGLAATKNLVRNSMEGVPSHGLNRVPRLMGYLAGGVLNPAARPTPESVEGAKAVYNGNNGFGNVNAAMAMDKACGLAQKFGVGVVSIHNTNHWMRGGAYGWQAANQGLIGMCWSNTSANMAPWGGTKSVIGNNPFVLAVPRENGQHLVVDCAMSQFSYGRLQSAAGAGEVLPCPGGWNGAGELTDKPEEILETRRVLPMGYWKGSGLSIALDIIGALLSGGNTVSDIAQKYTTETGLTQVMVAMCPGLAGNGEEAANRVLADIKAAAAPGETVRYPGEREYLCRQESLAKGVPVDEDIWNQVLALLPANVNGKAAQKTGEDDTYDGKPLHS